MVTAPQMSFHMLSTSLWYSMITRIHSCSSSSSLKCEHVSNGGSTVMICLVEIIWGFFGSASLGRRVRKLILCSAADSRRINMIFWLICIGEAAQLVWICQLGRNCSCLHVLIASFFEMTTELYCFIFDWWFLYIKNKDSVIKLYPEYCLKVLPFKRQRTTAIRESSLCVVLEAKSRT